jgi:indolepyruvate ferredoxin oxidoreductase alpha subunit
LKEEVGDLHISTDIGCHSFATFEPFSMGNSILGYGMSLASAAAVSSFQKQRPIAIMGDGGFWHNGLQTGVLSQMFNRGDAILIIMQNGYASATGQQYLPPAASPDGVEGGAGSKAGEIEAALRALHVEWIRTVRTYSVARVVDALREAITSDVPGLKVIIADGECMLARQRRLRRENAERLKVGGRVVVPRFGIDSEICTGDHACIRLSGCPSLTIADNPDPLKSDPITKVDSSCVGCGLCGENAHAATLCPSFYGVERVRNPGFMERIADRMRRRIIGWLADRQPEIGH